jgi:uncharacterized protein (DUF952 family)
VTRVYKILRQDEWASFQSSGIFHGSPDDIRDGFIHLSARDQLAGTLARHFRGEDGLVLLAIDGADLGEALKWEPSRGGGLFPHLYASLLLTAILSATPLHRADDGSYPLPSDRK